MTLVATSLIYASYYRVVSSDLSRLLAKVLYDETSSFFGYNH